MPLDPVVAAMLQQMAEAEGPAMVDVSPAEAREMYRALQGIIPKPGLHEIRDAVAGDVAIRIYRTRPGVTPCIVYFHGGGWVIGDLETHDGVCRQLALATDYTVIAVDYRLAPEHPFPAAIDDCYDATAWIANNAGTLSIDADRLAVAGDSAGGNLAACVCLKARELTSPAIKFQLLVVPVTDSAMDTTSYDENGEGYMLTRASMEWFWDHYAGDDAKVRTNPLAAPRHATDLSDLPPACIITAEFDPLRDEGERYAKALNDAGTNAHYACFDGMVHTFFGMTDMLEGSRAAMGLAAEKLKAALD